MDLHTRYLGLVDAMAALNKEVEDKLKLLEAAEESWTAVLERASSQAAAGLKKVKFNVGGREFAASRTTFLRSEGTYFHALLSEPGRWQPCEDDGAFFIDRDPKLFDSIMRVLREDSPPDFSDLSTVDAARLEKELDYYQLSPIASAMAWDAHLCGSRLTLSNHGRTVTKTSGSAGYNASVVGTVIDAAHFQVKIDHYPDSETGDVMVGYAKRRKVEAEKANYHKNGFFLCCYDGLAYCGSGLGKEYRSSLEQGDIIDVELDRAKGEISFAVNGRAHGAAFKIPVDCEALVPCIEIYHLNGSVTLG